MNSDTNRRLFPSLVDDVLSHPGQCVDNIFAQAWKSLNLNKLIQQAGFKKRTGVGITEALFLLVLWKWINASSIAVFCRQSLSTFSAAKKDVMYDLLKREDADWRGLHGQVGGAIYKQCAIATSRLKVFVLDDTMQERRGKKMEGVSCHFDHTQGRHIGAAGAHVRSRHRRPFPTARLPNLRQRVQSSGTYSRIRRRA